MDPNISDSSRRPPNGRMRLGLLKKACLRAPRALSCFMRRSLDRRFWNHTWDRGGGLGEMEVGDQALPPLSWSPPLGPNAQPLWPEAGWGPEKAGLSPKRLERGLGGRRTSQG